MTLTSLETRGAGKKVVPSRASSILSKSVAIFDNMGNNSL
jgi:hypothetical protein